MTPDKSVRNVMTPTFGCTPENHAADVAEMMDTMGLRFMAVVSDFASATAGLAGAYLMVEDERLIGVYDPGAEWQPAR